MLNLSKETSLSDYLKTCESLSASELKKKELNPFFGLEGGYYYKYIDAWFSVFGDSVRVYFFDDLARDPTSMLKDISLWLDIGHDIYDDKVLFSRENKTTPYKYKTLQRFALFINRTGEHAFRRYPKLKQLLRNLYYSANASTEETDLGSDVIHYINELYRQPNLTLRKIMRSHGYSTLPDWLTDSI